MKSDFGGTQVAQNEKEKISRMTLIEAWQAGVVVLKLMEVEKLEEFAGLDEEDSAQ